MKIVRGFSGKAGVILLILALLAAVGGGCGRQRSDSSPETEVESGDTTEAVKESRTYTLPKGAESEYVLYTTVIDFANNGYHYEELSEVYDRTLSTVFYTKSKGNTVGNYFEGMDYMNAYRLLTSLKEIAAEADVPADDEAAERMDITAFYRMFPDSAKEKIDADESGFRKFITDNIFRSESDIEERESEKPFRTSQTVKYRLPENRYVESRMTIKAGVDLAETFPQVFSVTLTDTAEGNTRYKDGYFFTEINRRYYVLGFWWTGELSGQ